MDRETIYRLRHDVYARELGQHQANNQGRLSDPLDAHNIYLVAKVAGQLAGFVSLTPPSAPSLSIDKYVSRDCLPFPVDEGLYEVRLLTVVKPCRGRELATLLMYAAFRWVESHGGTHIAAMGRREVLALYFKTGLRPVGFGTQAGAVHYDFLHATVAELRTRLNDYTCLLDRLESRVEWQLHFPLHKPTGCFHGGVSFAAIGERFETLGRNQAVINADVLDAWFPPAPGVLGVLQTYLPWLVRTSPPASGSGLVEVLAETRRVRPDNLLLGAGSSDLIFRALRHWLKPDSRVLILDPTYGEYAHILERVIGCQVERLPLARAADYRLDLTQLEAALRAHFNLIVLVNPNSPTGCHVQREALESVLRRAPECTRVWVDETYVEYAGEGQSLERFAAGSENVIICKSMSKVYALSGARVAYLCAAPHQLEELHAITPPWVVSLPAQVAAVRALQDPDYYAERYRQTHGLREGLSKRLSALGWTVLPGIANFLLCHLPSTGATAQTVVRACQVRGLFLRDAALMGTQLGPRAIRIAVKDAATNERMVAILAEALEILASQPHDDLRLVA